MALFGGIPLPSQSSFAENFLQGRKQRTAEDAEQQKIAQTALANKQLNEYRNSALNFQKELQPLKLNLLREKINAAKHEGLPELTKANITKNQQIIQNVEGLTPQIDDLLNSDFPGQTIGKYTHPSDQANYEARVAQLTDTLVGALGLPKTDASLHLAKQMVLQKPFESRLAYKMRIENLKKDLISRHKKASQYLRQRNVVGADAAYDGSTQQLGQQETQNQEQGNLERTPDGNVILYKKGKRYHIPPNMVDQALSSEEGFTIGRS